MGKVAHRRGDPDAEEKSNPRPEDDPLFRQMYFTWFIRVWNIADLILEDLEDTTQATKKTFLTAWDRQLHLEDSNNFGDTLVRLARTESLAIATAASATTSERLDKPYHPKNLSFANTEELIAEREFFPSESAPECPAAGRGLLAATARSFDIHDVSLLDLHLRHGLTAANLATELNAKAIDAYQKLTTLRIKLRDAVGNYAVWADGKPVCKSLATGLDGSTDFDRSTATILHHHLKTCEECRELRRAQASPEQSFSAVPLFRPPDTVMEAVATTLAMSGLPLDPDESNQDNAPIIVDLLTETPTSPSANSDGEDSDRPQISTDEQASADNEDPEVGDPGRHSESDEEFDSELEIDRPDKDSGPTLSTALASRFPASPEAPDLSERFKTPERSDSTSFAQDNPVRYSRRPPRTVQSETEPRVSIEKIGAIATAIILFVSAVLLYAFLQQDSNGVTTRGSTPSTSEDTRDQTSDKDSRFADKKPPLADKADPSTTDLAQKGVPAAPKKRRKSPKNNIPSSSVEEVVPTMPTPETEPTPEPSAKTTSTTGGKIRPKKTTTTKKPSVSSSKKVRKPTAITAIFKQA